MRIGATFRVHGMKPSRVTALLGLPPSSSDDEGLLWSLTVPAEDEADLELVLWALLDTLGEQRMADLRDRGGSLDLFCFVESAGLEPAVVLSPALLARVSAIEAELWLDIYGSD